MSWPKTGANHYHTQLGLLDKGRAIKELVVYWMLPYLILQAIQRVTLQFKRKIIFKVACRGLVPEASSSPSKVNNRAEVEVNNFSVIRAL